MQTYAEDGLAVSTITLGRLQEWVHHADSMLSFHRVNAKTIKSRLRSRRTVGFAHGGSVLVWRSSWAM